MRAMTDPVAAPPRAFPGAAGVPARPAHPAKSPLRDVDLAAFVAVNLAVVTGMWTRHGGLEQLHTTAGKFVAAGQLAGLYGAFAILAQIVLERNTPEPSQKLDWLGMALLSPGLTLFIFGLAESADGGFGQFKSWAPILAGVVLIGYRELRELQRGA